MKRIVAKHYDGEDYLILPSINNNEANVWSLEQQTDTGLWMVIADFFAMSAVEHYLGLFEHSEVLTAAFIVAGAKQTEGYAKVIAKMQMGDVEATDAMISDAKVVEKVWLERYKGEGVDFIWEYDISENVGVELIEFAKQFGHWPDDAWVERKAIELAEAAQT